MKGNADGSVVVVGAGIVGCSIAVHLLDRGLRPILIDPDRPGQGASAGSFASVSAFGKDPAAYFQLAVAGVAGWPRFAERLGGEVGLRRAGEVRVAGPGLLVETAPLPALTDRVVYLPGDPGPPVHLRQRADGRVLVGERTQETVATDPGRRRPGRRRRAAGPIPPGPLRRADDQDHAGGRVGVPRADPPGPPDLTGQVLCQEGGGGVRIRDVMSSPAVTVRPEMPLKDLADLLVERRISAAPVVEAGELVGIVSEADLLPLESTPDPRAHLAPLPEPPASVPRLVAQVMTREVIALPEEADVAEASRLMLEHGVRSIPVVHGRRVTGVVARRDLLKVLARSDHDIAGQLEALLASELGAPSPYRVAVRQGMVELAGPSDPTTRRRAGLLARGVPGVAGVRFRAEEPGTSRRGSTSNPAAVAYPRHREADVALRDGSTVHIRPARADDAAAVRAFYEGLSPESTALRFFSSFPNLDSAVAWATEVDFERRYSLLATGDGRVLAHAGWEREQDRPERAEVALAITDAMQGRGLGTILLGQLAEAADQAGVQVLTAEVLPQNHQMIQVFRDSGFPVTTHAMPGVLLVEVPTLLTPEGLERFERREQTAAVAAMRAFLAPRSVAVIGASRRRGTVGAELFHNLLAAGFAGPVYPVNSNAPVVQSVLAYKSILDVPGPVDLAVVAVPAPAVLPTAEQCAAAGARALVVISAGFAETGPEGAERQERLLRVCRGSGMRLIGPNCLGILNTNAEVRLDAIFGPSLPRPGRVGFLSQSGALGLSVLDYAAGLGLGLSSFVSVGNKADISSNDLLDYWEDDPDTAVALLYLESFGNPRRFARIARRVGHSKPIVAVKSGRSAAGARASSSHTGALLAASDITVEALFRQAGVIRTDTLAELFDVATLLANQPRPRGRRVGIVTNAGGPGILCADACEAAGLEVAELSAGLRARLAEGLPAAASVTNPVDMLAAAPAEHYRRTVELVVASGEVDAVIVIFIPPLLTEPADVARAVRAAVEAAGGAIPVLAVFMSAAGGPPELRAGDPVIPGYAFPEEAARALGRAAEYGSWRERPEGRVPDLSDARRDEAAGLLAAALADSPSPNWLPPEQVAELLDCYGIAMAPWRLAGTPEEAGAAAAELGGPVALKAVAPGLVHKTEAHGVRLGLAGADQVRSAAEEMVAMVAAAGYALDRFLVERMVPGGIELLVGVVNDRSFGPVVALGAGGIAVEPLKDVAVRLTPMTDRDAAEMVRSLATFPLLEGYRGAPKADAAALEDLLLRVGALADTHPQVAELDLNPVKALPEGVIVVDARVRVEAAVPPPPLASRRR